MEKQKILYLGEKPCYFCMENATKIASKEDKMYVYFQCYECRARAFFLKKFATEEVLDRLQKIMLLNLGKDWKNTIKENIEATAEQEFYCPLCFTKINSIKETKKKGIWFWQCGKCLSRGFCSKDVLPTWTSASFFLSIFSKTFST